MSILFVGDLQLKYLHHVLEDDSSARFSSGFLVEQIMALLSGVVLDVRTITIHVRTNNIPHEDPITILHRNRYLLKSIWKANPSARIIASGILPRDATVLKKRVTTLDSLIAATENQGKSTSD